MNICGRKEQIFAKKFEPFVNPYVITKIKQTITQKKMTLTMNTKIKRENRNRKT